jgi:hypothetical protein
MAQRDFAQKLEMCETLYTEQMQHMHLSLEEKAAVEVGTRVKARFLDAVHIHYRKAQAMAVLRSFAKWHETVVLDKSNKIYSEVIYCLVSPYFLIYISTESHLFSACFSMDLLSSSFVSPYSVNMFCIIIERNNPISYFSFLSYLILIVVSYRIVHAKDGSGRFCTETRNVRNIVYGKIAKYAQFHGREGCCRSQYTRQGKVARRHAYALSESAGHDRHAFLC